MRKLLVGSVVIVILVIAVVVGAKYQATIYLMPTPAVISSSDINPFDINPNLEKSNELRILFATNRVPAGETENRTYTIFPGNTLRIGVVRMQIGEDETAWEKIIKLSTTEIEDDRPPLRMQEIQELVQYPLKDSNVNQSASNQALAHMINSALEARIDKDITIYVHGANTGIYRASAQAAQYHHFTGQNSMVMVFLWPSAENLLGYGTDTRHARKSAPAFARLLALLAEHTNAENINILAYSAGAQIISPALDILGRNTAQNQRSALRIGKVYFAAADIGIDTFVTHLMNYIDIPRSTTLAINRSDGALTLSAFRNRISRAGSPNANDLNASQQQWIIDSTQDSQLILVGVSAETVSGLSARSHDFWYSHPWVSSDVLTQFIFHKTPSERGLVEMNDDRNLRYWLFPPDYPQRIIDIVETAAESRKN